MQWRRSVPDTASRILAAIDPGGPARGAENIPWGRYGISRALIKFFRKVVTQKLQKVARSSLHNCRHIHCRYNFLLGFLSLSINLELDRLKDVSEPGSPHSKRIRYNFLTHKFAKYVKYTIAPNAPRYIFDFG